MSRLSKWSLTVRLERHGAKQAVIRLRESDPGGGGLLPRLCLHEPAGRQLIGVVGDDFSDRCPNGIKHVGVPMEEGLLP